MLKKIKKIKLYYKALYKGELLKKIEYKIKDSIGYFYIRNKLQNKIKFCKLYDVNINVQEVDEELIEEKYTIFNKEYNLEEFIEKLNTEKVFWRNVKLNQYEDVKILWEFNRLQILLPIAIKYLKTNNIKYKESIENILDIWEQNNPFEYSLNWNSNLEVAIRAINIVLCLLLLQDKELNNKYSKLLYLHAKHIYSEIDYSDCCIPNNHVIGEATALLVLSKVLNVKENNKWYKKSINILTKYIDIIDDDGISKENSFSYQFFVTKMYILALCFVEDEKIFRYISYKVRKSLQSLNYIIKPNEKIPNYGDNDNAFLYSIKSKYNIEKDIKQYYNFFNNGECSLETYIYISIFEEFNKKNSIMISEFERIEYIKTENIFVYKWKNNFLFFNAKPIEGHAHNDSLAIELYINGKDVFIDEGTYSYNISKEERLKYRERKAHNTIQVKKINTYPIGTFRWIDNEKSYISNFYEDNKKIVLQGKINNIATREIVIYKLEHRIEIKDNSLNEEQISVNWITPIRLEKYKSNCYCFENIYIEFNETSKIKQEQIEISEKYLEKSQAILYEVESSNSLETIINYKE